MKSKIDNCSRYWEVFDRIRSKEPGRCRYVRLFEQKTPDRLDEKELAFYAYWRSNIEKGIYLKADVNYARIWMVEAANYPMDEESFTNAVGILKDELNMAGDEMTRFVFSWYVSNGLPLTDRYAPDTVMYANYLLASASTYEPDLFYWLDGKDIPDEDTALMFGRAVAHIDHDLSERTGTGLFDRIMLRHTMGFNVFQGLPHRGSGRIAYEYMEIMNPDASGNLLNLILQSVRDIIDGKEVDPEFGMFEESIRKGISGEPVPTIPRMINSYELDGTNGKGVRDPTVVVLVEPLRLKDMNGWISGCPGYRDYMEDTPYTPSSLATTNPTNDENVHRYYERWKMNMEKGIFLDTDEGYVELYLKEMSMRHWPTGEVFEMVRTLKDRYGIIKALESVIKTAITEDLPLPHPDLYPEGGSFDLFMSGLVRFNQFDLDVRSIKLRIARSWYGMLFTDGEHADVLRRWLFDTDGYLFDRYDGLPGYLGAGDVTVCEPHAVSYYYLFDYAKTVVPEFSDERCIETVSDVLDTIISRMSGKHPEKMIPAHMTRISDDFSEMVDSCITRHELSGGRPFECTDSFTEAKMSYREIQELLDGIPIEPCGYVPCGGWHTTPEFMTDEQRRYYVYWRSRLSDGEFLPCDISFFQDRVDELQVSEDPLEHRLAELELMERSERLFRPYFRDARMKILIGSGKLSDSFSPRRNEELVNISVTDMLSHPPAHLSKGDVDDLMFLMGRDPSPDNPEWNEMFNRMIQTLSRKLMDDTGLDIPRTLSSGSVLNTVSLPDQSDGYWEKTVMSEYISTESLDALLVGIVNLCNKNLVNKRTRITYNRLFTREIGDAVSSGYTNCDCGIGMGIKDRSPHVDGRMLSLPRRFNLHLNPYREPSDEYVMSDTNEGYAPTVSSYYAWWTSEVRDGRYPPTDTGYLWRYLEDDVLTCTDPKETLSELYRLRDIYDPMDRSGLLFDCIIGVCLKAGIPLKDSGHRRDMAGMSIVLWQIAMGKGGSLTKEGISVLSGISASVEGDLTDLGVEVINNCLIECAARFGNKITKFKSAFGLSSTGNMVSTPGKIADGKFMEIKEESLKSMMIPMMKDLVKDVNSIINGRKKATHQFGPLSPDDVDRIAGNTGKTVRARRVDLDRDAVSDAESDLRNVTDMMRIEAEDEESDVPEEPVATAVSGRSEGDPWDLLASDLTPDETRLILAIAGGKGFKRILNSMKMTISQAEDAINAKSLNRIGDTILENGSVVDDYIGDLTTVLMRNGAEDE